MFLVLLIGFRCYKNLTYKSMELNKIKIDKYNIFDEGVYHNISKISDGLILFKVSTKIKEPILISIRRMVVSNIYNNIYYNIYNNIYNNR